MATLATLRTAVRRLLDETDSSNSVYSDAELLDYLNQALRKTATEMEWPIAQATATVVTEQQAYSLPTNFLILLTIYMDDKKLDLIDLQDLSSMFPNYRETEANEPKWAFRRDTGQIGLYPKPASTYSGQTLLIEYIKLPSSLSDDADAPDLNDVVADIVPFYAAMLAQLRAGNIKTAGGLEALYTRELKSLKAKVIKYSDDLVSFRWA